MHHPKRINSPPSDAVHELIFPMSPPESDSSALEQFIFAHQDSALSAHSRSDSRFAQPALKSNLSSPKSAVTQVADANPLAALPLARKIDYSVQYAKAKSSTVKHPRRSYDRMLRAEEPEFMYSVPTFTPHPLLVVKAKPTRRSDLTSVSPPTSPRSTSSVSSSYQSSFSSRPIPIRSPGHSKGVIDDEELFSPVYDDEQEIEYDTRDFQKASMFARPTYSISSSSASSSASGADCVYENFTPRQVALPVTSHIASTRPKARGRVLEEVICNINAGAYAAYDFTLKGDFRQSNKVEQQEPQQKKRGAFFREVQPNQYRYSDGLKEKDSTKAEGPTDSDKEKARAVRAAQRGFLATVMRGRQPR